MQREKYNEWVNYETWNAALWCDNDRGINSYLTEAAQQCYDEADGTAEERISDATMELADIIQSMFEDNVEAITVGVSGWIADAINTYLGEVDWREIAEHYFNEVDKSNADNKEEETA